VAALRGRPLIHSSQKRNPPNRHIVSGLEVDVPIAGDLPEPAPRSYSISPPSAQKRAVIAVTDLYERRRSAVASHRMMPQDGVRVLLAGVETVIQMEKSAMESRADVCPAPSCHDSFGRREVDVRLEVRA